MAALPLNPSLHIAAARGLRIALLLVAGISVVPLFLAFHLGAYANWILSGLFLTAGTFLLSASRGGRNRDLFQPACLFPAVYCFWFAIGSLDVVPEMYQVSLFDLIPLRMWGYYAVGLAGYWLGMRAVGANQLVVPRLEKPTQSWDSRRFALAMAALTLLGTAMYISLVWKGGIPVLREDWAESRVEMGSQNGIAFAIFLSAFWTVIPLMYAFLWTGRRDWMPRWSIYAISAIQGLMLFSLGSRGLVFIPAVIVVILRHYLVRPWKLKTLLALASAVFTAVGVVGYVRDYVGGNTLSDLGFPVWAEPLAPAYLYVRGPIATFRDVSAVIGSRDMFQHGALFLSPFAVLAPGHHLSSDLFFKALLRHSFLGFGEPATLLGVFYADFGVPGIFLGMTAVGLLAGWSYRAMGRSQSLLAALLFSYYAYVLLFSLFGTLFPYLITLWIPLMFVAVDRFARRPSAICGSAA
ncbi:MAG: O-antigen polymerase [Candidatus Sulfotelmatobacter sp.]